MTWSAIWGRMVSRVPRSKRLPRARRCTVCAGRLRRERVRVISRVAGSCQRPVSGWRSCQSKSGTSQFRPRRTWLQASNPVTKYPPQGRAPIAQCAQLLPDGERVGLSLGGPQATKEGNDGSAVGGGTAYDANGGHAKLLCGWALPLPPESTLPLSFVMRLSVLLPSHGAHQTRKISRKLLQKPFFLAGS